MNTALLCNRFLHFDHNYDGNEKIIYEKISNSICSKIATKLIFLLFVPEQVSYSLNNIDDIDDLSDIPYLEAQAQFVGNFAELYYKIRYEDSSIGMKQLVKMNQIIENSGIYSEVTKWIDENLK